MYTGNRSAVHYFIWILNKHLGTTVVTCRLIVVDIDSLQLEIGVTMVCASWVDTVLIGDHLPELEQNKSNR